MAKILSTPTSVTVATLPYQPPAPGTAMLIGTNTGADVRPSPDTPDQWSYATMECYGSGTFVADYSSTGAWAVAGCGGHQAAAIYGALIFDFDSATWSYVHNANNFPNRVWSLTASESSSIGEISVSGVTGNMPAPAHVYRYCVGLSKANGGGQRGSLLMTTGAGVDDAGGRQLNYAYKIDLGTGLWSRATTNKRTDAYSGYGYFIEGSAATDPTSRRVYVTPAELSGLTALPYIDLADMTWKAVARGGMTPTDQQCSTFVDVARRLLNGEGYVVGIKAYHFGGTAVLHNGLAERPVQSEQDVPFMLSCCSTTAQRAALVESFMSGSRARRFSFFSAIFSP